MSLLILNANATEPTDYSVRKVVKGVILNEEGKALLLSHHLIGGGVEEGETDEEAMHREALEEAGIALEILKPLGEVIGYRDALRKKYVIHGYLCRYMKTISKPTTTDPGEQKMVLIWASIEDSIARVQSEIDALKKEGPGSYEGDEYQSRIYNRATTVTFLKEAIKQINASSATLKE